jgi:hypothetical protein
MSIYGKLADIQAQLDDVTTREVTTAGSVRLTGYLSASAVTASAISGLSSLDVNNAAFGAAETTILTVNTTLMTVNKDENNRVGIGTTTPTAILTVNGTSHFTGSLTATNIVSGSTGQFTYVKLPLKELASATNGTLAVSEQGKLYFYSGSWKEVALV